MSKTTSFRLLFGLGLALQACRPFSEPNALYSVDGDVEVSVRNDTLVLTHADADFHRRLFRAFIDPIRLGQRSGPLEGFVVESKPDSVFYLRSEEKEGVLQQYSWTTVDTVVRLVHSTDTIVIRRNESEMAMRVEQKYLSAPSAYILRPDSVDLVSADLRERIELGPYRRQLSVRAVLDLLTRIPPPTSVDVSSFRALLLEDRSEVFPSLLLEFEADGLSRLRLRPKG